MAAAGGAPYAWTAGCAIVAPMSASADGNDTVTTLEIFTDFV